MPDPAFGLGDRVRLKAAPTTVGIVVTPPASYEGGWTYEVFFGATDTRWVNEGGLEYLPSQDELLVLDRAAFLRRMLLAKLESPLSDLFYSYQASRTQFESYQFKPVLKFLDATSNGILIADEVGLGKTIEAAIIYEELKARSNIRRVLVICPAGLRVKWQSELLTRFDESFAILDGKAMLEDIRRYSETDGRQPLNGIIGLEAIRLAGIQDAFDGSNVRFDLVIIDEAHHLRTAGRLSNQIGSRLADLADHLVLLTATPLQTSDVDLYNLLGFLDESMFDSYDDFRDQLEPNQFLNGAIRALRERPPDQRKAVRQLEAITQLRAGGQVMAHPNFAFALKRLSGGPLSVEDRVRLQREIDRMNVLSAVYTRTRKRDVARVAKRQAHVVQVPITEAERAFYVAVLAHARSQARAMSRNGWIPGFAGMMRERQAASCLAATREFLQASLQGSTEDLQVEDENGDAAPEVSNPAIGAPATTRSELDELLRAARALGPVDSKFEMFRNSLSGVLDADGASKILVFSYFRRTLAYLERELIKAGIPVLVIHGGVPPIDRARVIDLFREDPNMRVLLTSEVGAEGLDFQFADTLFNYDLPWNPMRVEQRIGRVDRYGQKREKIRVYSFFLQDTIEERILERLYLRIGIFEDSIGDLEPILGPLAAELTQAIFSAELTPAEEIELADRIADQIAYRKEEQSDLEQRQSELLGQDALLLQAIDDTVTSGRYVSGAELRAIVEGYLEATGAVARLQGEPSDESAILITDSRMAGAVEDHVFATRDQRAVANEFLARATRGARIPVTFDGEVAARSRRLELLSLRHPLVQAAVAHFRRHGDISLPIADLEVDELEDLDRLEGPFEFAIFRLQLTGAQPRTSLSAVVFSSNGTRSPRLEAQILRLFSVARDSARRTSWARRDRDSILERATLVASADADIVEREAREKNDTVIAVREATLQRTYRTRISRRERQLGLASDERIQRLRMGEIRNLREELDRRLRALDDTRSVGVSFAPLAVGRIVMVAPAERTFPTTVSESTQGPIPDPEFGLEATRFQEPGTSWKRSDGSLDGA
ncbi:MAG: DEAD/DEAH box helicase [Chloroflexi bacterium]|nr:DEAD/DEAH box helicase [Chloroflexota bacterium]